MKKMFKGLMIASGILVVAGGGISAAAMAMGADLKQAVQYSGSHLESTIMESVVYQETKISPNTTEGSDENITVSAADIPAVTESVASVPSSQAGEYVASFPVSQVNELELEVKIGKVVLLNGGETDQITVMADSASRLTECYVEEGELKIKSTYLNKDGGEICIYIPENYRFDNVDIDLKKGNVMVGFDGQNNTEFFKAGKLDLTVESGSIEVGGANVGVLEVNCKRGYINYSGWVFEGVEAECKTGSIDLLIKGKETDYNYEIKSQFGSVTVGDNSYAGLKNKNFVNNNAGKKMELDCEQGAIEVAFDDSL